MMSRIVINGSGSAECNCSMFYKCKYDISLSLLSKLKDNDEECAIQQTSAIVDFLNYYDIYILNNLYGKLLIICVLFNSCNPTSFLSFSFVISALYMYMFYTRL